MQDSSIRPFKIHVSHEELDDLKRRLLTTRWPDRETVDDWSQGTPLAYLKEVCEYWCNDYDWRRLESNLNAYPQFLTHIDGLDIHFLHIRSQHENALPLVMTHGWPGSILEFMKVIGPLTDPTAHGGEAKDAFHVVCPSLPGYGFSDKPTAVGWGVEHIAAAWAVLMARLGYDKYAAQGGDWGGKIITCIGIQDPEHCVAIHTNWPIVPPDLETMGSLTPFEQACMTKYQHHQIQGRGYAMEQGTRPQSLGYGLTDSPAGQAGWVLEKFQVWSDCNGHPENVFTRDELLDNIMMYWITNSATSSARLYWENSGKSFANNSPVLVPTGFSLFPKEIYLISRRWAEKRFTNIVYWNDSIKHGGHFAAFEQPEILVEEIRKCFRLIR